MQRFRIYIRNRYQTTELRGIQQCVVSEDVLDLHSSTHPPVLISTRLSLFLSLSLEA